jgi:hypothetical protein
VGSPDNLRVGHYAGLPIRLLQRIENQKYYLYFVSIQFDKKQLKHAVQNLKAAVKTV